METNGLPIDKSEILFLYESSFSVPNGDPFTSEQRYDEETKKALVSDVRIKRFIRDYFVDLGETVYVIDDRSSVTAGGTASGAAVRMLSLKTRYKGDPDVMTTKPVGESEQAVLALIQDCLEHAKVNGVLEDDQVAKLKGQLTQITRRKKPQKALLDLIDRYERAAEGAKDKARTDVLEAMAKYGAGKGKPAIDALKVMKKCIDVRLFGGISTEEGDAVNLTGPVQFALLNPSLNKVDLRMHQNTSVFSSSEEKTRGAIGTTTVVPYSLNQIHGWINPYSARHTDLEQKDITEMFSALWASINNANTRSKSNQNSMVLLQIVYADPNKKLYGVDRFIRLTTEKQEEQIRSSDDYKLDFSKLKDAVDKSDAVKQVNFYTETPGVRKELEGANKFNLMELL
jgi:CRISPR-associated protein Csh2